MHSHQTTSDVAHCAYLLGNPNKVCITSYDTAGTELLLRAWSASMKTLALYVQDSASLAFTPCVRTTVYVKIDALEPGDIQTLHRQISNLNHQCSIHKKGCTEPRQQQDLVWYCTQGNIPSLHQEAISNCQGGITHSMAADNVGCHVDGMKLCDHE